MKTLRLLSVLFILLMLTVSQATAQEQQTKQKKISFYGGFGLNFGTGYTYVSLQPGIIYNLHPKFKLGGGVQYTYLKSHNSYYGVNYKYNILGFNTMALYNPLKEMEISVEYEDLYVKQNYNDIKHNFWSPALFGGMGYRYGPLVIGLKFNFLYNEKTSIYQDAFIPYVRIYF